MNASVPVVLLIDEQQFEILLGLVVTAKAATGLSPEEVELFEALWHFRRDRDTQWR